MLWRMRPRPDAASRRLARDLPNRRTGGGVVTALFLVGDIADLRSDMRDLARRVTSLEGELYELQHDDDGWPE